MGSSRIYLDTSAYLSMLLVEADAKIIKKQLLNVQVCSSTILLLEAERNLLRAARQAILDEDQYDEAYQQLQLDKELFVLRDFTLDLCLNREFPVVKTPRSSDLAHLRTALWFKRNGGLLRFLSLDKQQNAAARELGLMVSTA